MHSSNNSAKRTFILLSALAATLVLPQPGNAQTPTPKTTAAASQHIVLPSRKDTLPYSDGVLVGETFYLAGRIGIDPETGKPPAELEKEIRFLLDGMKTTLAAANMTMDDLVSVQVFCPDLSLYEKFNEIYRTYFIKDFPARAFIGSGPLLRGGRFEAQGIAVRR
ncbi:MAG: 2-iminobutanoate/2-iminopropanoate deaminase [Verrucomicrobiota bacterium]|jgi:enamine deaminase RidA (YjgF/YER057c/UK114 family)